MYIMPIFDFLQFSLLCSLILPINTSLIIFSLPHMIDGEVRLSQTSAILRYIGGKHDMLGKDAEQEAIVDMANEEAMDMFWRLRKLLNKNEEIYAEGLPNSSRKSHITWRDLRGSLKKSSGSSETTLLYATFPCGIQYA